MISRMVSADLVKTNEVAAVQGDENPLLRDGEGQNVGVGNGPTGVAALGSRHVVPQPPQCLDHG